VRQQVHQRVTGEYVNGIAVTVDAYRTENGYAVVETNGQTQYPDPDFSGEDNFAYTTMTDQGPKTYTVDVTVRPITNDVPQIPHDGETNATHPHLCIRSKILMYLLGLKAPVITDPTDQNGATADDHPERLGVITLTLSGAGAVAGTELLNGATPLIVNGSVFTVVIVDAVAAQRLLPAIIMLVCQVVQRILTISLLLNMKPLR
jgi:hypothetical protein